jgi:nicotinamide-nucleotide amidase
MLRDEVHAERIRQRILSRRGSVAESVLRMAEYPETSEPLPNSQGVALGVAMRHRNRWIFAAPGVPREMKAMVDDEVMPRLRRSASKAAVIRSRVLHTWGLGESQVAEMLDDLYAATNPSIAFLIADMEVRVRITAKADTAEAAEALIEPVEGKVRDRLGDIVFATDDETVLDVLEVRLAERGWTVAVHEHGTDGLVLHRLGSLAQFVGGALVRTSSSADVMAEAARAGFAADVGLGISAPRVVDDAGDFATELDVAIHTPEGSTVETMRFFGTGERARAYAVIAAVHRLRLAVKR